MPDTIRIAMWSGPRNISTAMMRAWDSRADTTVMDEPFYGAYLASTGLEHPMAAEIMAHHPTDWHVIAQDCATCADAPVVYQKHMCQHMIAEAPLEWMSDTRHAFLIRPPGDVAASFKAKWDGMTEADIGFRRQAELFDRVCQADGKAPPVLLSDDVLTNPRAALTVLCSALDVPFDPAMLSWQAGPRATDGIWASHWYASVNASTGFGPPKPAKPVPETLKAIVDECQPWFDRMAAHKLLVDSA